MRKNFKKSGVKSLCAIIAAASMMSVAVPAFAESNENLDAYYTATREEDRAAWMYREMNEGWGEPEEVTPSEPETQIVTPDNTATREEDRAAWMYREMNEGWGEPEEVTPVDTTVTVPEIKPEAQKVKLSIPETIPHYGDIKRCYFEKGAGVAFCMFIYYHPTPLGYEVIEYIEKTIKKGDRGYTIDGVHYDCPENDPYFKDKHILYTVNDFK